MIQRGQRWTTGEGVNIRPVIGGLSSAVGDTRAVFMDESTDPIRPLES